MLPEVAAMHSAQSSCSHRPRRRLQISILSMELGRPGLLHQLADCMIVFWGCNGYIWLHYVTFAYICQMLTGFTGFTAAGFFLLSQIQCTNGITSDAYAHFHHFPMSQPIILIILIQLRIV